MRSTATTAPVLEPMRVVIPARRGARLALTLENRWRSLAGFLGALALSVFMGLAVASTDGVVDYIGGHVEIPLVLGAALAVAIVARGPVACLTMTVAVAAAGGRIVLAQFGGVDLALPDVFYLGLVGWCVWNALGRPDQLPACRRPRLRMGQDAAAVFIGIGCLSVLHVAIVEPDRFSLSAISWIRFAQTLSIAWLAASVIRTRPQLVWVMRGLVVGSLVSIVAGIVQALDIPTLVLSTRFQGFTGPNALSLAGGVLLAFGLFAAVSRDKRVNFGIVLFGAAALLLGKSVGALVGTGVAVAIGMAFRGQSARLHRTTAAVAAIAIALAVVFGLVQWLRPSAAPGSADFQASSTSQRLILGAAALDEFSHHPIIGVGWRRSDEPTVIGERERALRLRDRFPGAQQVFFPDVNPSSVHNSYLQILADMGLVGFLALIGLMAALWSGIARTLRLLTPEDPLWAPAWGLAVALVLGAVWLNDSPLYGGQVETVVLAAAVGCLAAIGRMTLARRV